MTNIPMPCKKSGDALGIPAMLAHAQLKCFEAFQMYPRIERAHRRARIAQEQLQMILQEILPAQDYAAQRPALAVNVFGRGMNHDIGAELHRPLQCR